MTSASLMHEAGHSKLVLWDSPEGWGGEEREGGVQDRGTHVYLWLIHVNVWHNPPQYCNYPPKNKGFSSVTQSCPTLCNHMDCSTPGLSVHHQLPEFTQIHVHWVGDAIQPSHPLLSPSPLSFSLSQHQGLSLSQLFTLGGWSIGVSTSASVLPMNIQNWFPLGWTGWISFLSRGLSRVFSNTTVQKHQFFGTQLSFWSNSHIHTWILEKP